MGYNPWDFIYFSHRFRCKGSDAILELIPNRQKLKKKSRGYIDLRTTPIRCRRFPGYFLKVTHLREVLGQAQRGGPSHEVETLEYDIGETLPTDEGANLAT